MVKKALLFINGQPPLQLPNLKDFDVIACTDGAIVYLEKLGFPLEKLTFISGDFDSHPEDIVVLKERLGENIPIILTDNQNYTDFDKALKILLEYGCSIIMVYGASGGEQDHFLGNLTTAYQYKDQLQIIFEDENSSYYFIPKDYTICGVKGKMISLYPFPFAENIVTRGLHWSLTHENLSQLSRIGTRNFAEQDEVHITFEKGDILFFVGQKYHKS